MPSSKNKKLTTSEGKKIEVDSSSTAEEPSNVTANNKEKSYMDFNFDEFLKSENFPGAPGLLTVSFNIL